MDALKRAVQAFSAVLYKIVEIINVLLLAMVVIIVSLEVFMRHILNQGFGWTLEIGTLLLQYIAFASMVLGVRYRLHIALLVVYNKMSAKVQKVLDKVFDVCVMVFGFMICYFGYGITSQMWRFTLPATRWPQVLTYMICIFAGAIIMYEGLVSLLGLSDKTVTWKAAEPFKEKKKRSSEEGEAVV